MANNTWGIYPWNQGEWGQQTIDVVVDVGTAQGWGRVTWGEGAWNESVPIDALSLNSGTALVSGKAQVSLTGNNLQVSTGTTMSNENSTVPMDTCALAPETSKTTGKEKATVPTFVCNCKSDEGADSFQVEEPQVDLPHPFSAPTKTVTS